MAVEPGFGVRSGSRCMRFYPTNRVPCDSRSRAVGAAIRVWSGTSTRREASARTDALRARLSAVETDRIVRRVQEERERRPVTRRRRGSLIWLLPSFGSTRWATRWRGGFLRKPGNCSHR